MSSRRSFHCMQATWQALQPMHELTSMSLATSGWWRASGEGVVVADRSAMSRDWSDDMVRSPAGPSRRRPRPPRGAANGCEAPSGSWSRLLDVDDERLVFRRLRVGVADDRRQRVHEVARLGDADEAPVDRQAHRVRAFAVDVERGDSLGHDRNGLDVAALGAHLDPVAVGDALLLAELLADLDELFGLDDG